MSVILVHGGAGPLAPDDDAERAKEGCRAAARAGWAVLSAGGSALDAVEAAVRTLEDDSVFNAGTGSALTLAGDVEMDASIMDGATRKAGAVAVVKTFPNPVRLARAVLDRSPHVMLAGDGAHAFGRSVGLGEVEPGRLVTPRALARWRARLAERAGGPATPGGSGAHGTVGAVAVDEHRHVAAATSTGGTSGKLPGRVGDSPLIGCGTYADDRGGAASATGLGEAIIRVTLARHAVDLLAGGCAPMDAARQAVATLQPVGGSGGIILVTPAGLLGWACDTPRMAWAWLDPTGGAAGFERDNS